MVLILRLHDHVCYQITENVLLMLWFLILSSNGFVFALCMKAEWWSDCAKVYGMIFIVLRSSLALHLVFSHQTIIVESLITQRKNIPDP